MNKRPQGRLLLAGSHGFSRVLTLLLWLGRCAVHAVVVTCVAKAFKKREGEREVPSCRLPPVAVHSKHRTPPD